MSAVTDFFSFLQIQISENVIVEDELDLARLAALVPDLCDALHQTRPITANGAAVLARAQLVVAEIAQSDRAYASVLNTA